VILYEEGAELWAKKGFFKNTNDALLTFIDCYNIKILGNGTRFCMNKDEYVDGEWRHGISLRGVTNFEIKDLDILNSGGDGIYIAGSKSNASSNAVTIKNIKSLNNKRQGISIISAKDVTISNCVFAETKGTLPGAGLDIEPNKPSDIITNIKIQNCVFENNYGAGIVVGLRKLSGTSNDISVSFENCVLRNNHALDNKKVAAEIIIGANSKDPVQGQLIFQNLLIENSNWGMFYTRKRSDAFKVKFVDCSLKNICLAESYPVMYFEVPDYYKSLGNLGGMSFENLSIESGKEIDLLLIRGSKLGTLKHLENINATVYHSGLSDNPITYVNYSWSNNKNVSINYIEKSRKKSD